MLDSQTSQKSFNIFFKVKRDWKLHFDELIDVFLIALSKAVVDELHLIHLVEKRMLRWAEVVQFRVEHENGKDAFIHSKYELVDAGKVLSLEYFQLVNGHELVGLVYTFIHFEGSFFIAFFFFWFFWSWKLDV